MVRLSDIATEAGCSVTVVSRVLHPGNEGVGHRIAAATRERVLAAAARLRYHPNRSAEFLKRGYLPEIGVCTTDVANNLVLDLVRGASTEAEREGFYVSFRYSLASMSGGGEEFLAEAARRHLCGIIMYSDFLLEASARERLEGYLSGGGEVVVLDVGNEAHPSWSLPTVAIDDELGGRLAARHLLSCDVEHFFYAGVERLRRDGFLSELAAHGHSATLFSFHETQRAVEACLSLEGSIGLFCSSDWQAMQIHSLLLQAGERPGGRIRLMGYDNLYGAAAISPALTTIRQPFGAAGAQAVTMLIRRLYGFPVANCRLEPELVLRET